MSGGASFELAVIDQWAADLARRTGINVAGGSWAAKNPTMFRATSAGRSIGGACEAAGIPHICPAGSASYRSQV
jgi:hypothetical protein